MIRMAANRLSNLTKVISSHPQSKLLTLSSQFASFTTNSTINSNLTTSISSKFKILQKKQINHDCYIYMLGWAGPKFKMSIGQHFRIVENIPTYQHPEGEEVIRKYTPISPCSQQDLIQLLIKVYRPNVSKEFPKGGKLTPYLQKLNVGDYINIDGPFGKFGYKSGGIVVINKKQYKKKRIFFIAGGSGITPCYQTITQILKLQNQPIQLILLFANKSQQDIILRKQLQQLQPRLKLYYSLDVAPQKWGHFSGYVTKQILEKVCPLDDTDTFYVHCGPKGMNVSIRGMFAKYFPNSDLFKY